MPRTTGTQPEAKGRGDPDCSERAEVTWRSKNVGKHL